MTTRFPRIQVLLACVLATLAFGSVAVADDSEVFLGAPSGGVPPNILLIIDTSGSMNSQVTSQTPYDPTVTYAGSCTSNQVYFARFGNNPPGCNSIANFAPALNRCASSATALAFGAGTSIAANPGLYTDKLIRWTSQGGRNPSYAWAGALNARGNAVGYEVDCATDYTANLSPYPTSGSYASNSAANEWTVTAAGSYWSSAANVTSATTFTLYVGNYLNWSASASTVLGTRISIVKSAATTLINQMNGVNFGLMRYSGSAGPGNSPWNGGYVAYPVSDVATNRTALVNTLAGFDASSWTPIAGTLYEAYQYFSGGGVYFGDQSTPALSVAGSRTGNTLSSHTYQSPIKYSCQKNYIVFLTDGLPTEDNDADSLILGLPNEATLAGPCDNTNLPPYSNLPGGWGPSQTAGMCTAPLSQYMFQGDVSPLPGQQNVQSYFIGFGNDPALAAAFGWLQSAATRGGGQAFTAGDLTSLQAVLTAITGSILQTSTTFTAPTVAVNAFNKTQTLNDLYVAMFRSAAAYHWPGNIKKFSVANGQIVDANAAPAVDPATGFFFGSSQSIWSATPDGNNVSAGGAAHMIPFWDPAAAGGRKMYTYPYSGSPAAPVDLTTAPYQFVASNTAINPPVAPGVLGVATPAAQTSLINFIRGENLTTGGERFAMGDPLHAQPAVVIYGGTTATPNVNDAIVYATENDGMLHAIDVVTGVELWAFLPYDVLPLLQDVQANPVESVKQYALDGSVKVLKYDINGDGIIDAAAGDRVLIYFAQGRGGGQYYAMDVTNKNAPQFLWSIGPSQLPAVTLAWSNPQITKVNVAGATQNSQKLVLIVGGGYDLAEETATYAHSDTHGNALYMLDALTGAVLWSASGTGSPSLTLSRMDHAIPSDVAVLDLDGDGYADRMYVGDLAGQVWRFDIYNGQPAATLVTGGVIASVGAHDLAFPPPPADTRRFYSAPDVAELKSTTTNQPFFNIAIGSGYRGHPLDITAQDRLYAIRDYTPFMKLTQASYNALTVLSDASLTDITASVNPTGGASPLLLPNAPGWKLTLNQPGNAWIGEKSLSAATTFNNMVLFTTYTPSSGAVANPCQPGIGNNKFYAISPFDGRPVANLNGQLNQSITDRSMGLSQGGIAPGVAFLFPPPAAPVLGGPPPGTQQVVCMAGVEVLGACRNFNSKIKTYWNATDAQ